MQLQPPDGPALFFLPIFLFFFHAIKQLKLWKIPTLSKQAGKQRPYCGFLFGPAKSPKPRMCTACPRSTDTHTYTHTQSGPLFQATGPLFTLPQAAERGDHGSPLSVCHYRPRNLILQAPILQYYCCLPLKGVKGAHSVEWIGGKRVKAALSVYTASGGSVTLRQNCNYKASRLINTGRRTLFHAGISTR